MVLPIARTKEAVLKALSLTKVIRGRTLVRDFSLELNPGDICGFIGPNGAGKTTTLRMLTGLMRPTAGEVFLNSHSLAADRRRALMQVGAMVETPGLFLYMTGRQNLTNMARLHPNLPPARRAQRIAEVLELVGLSDRAGDKVATYSLGMKQRLGLALALLGEPNLVILDEPANGLDPFGTRELRALILRLQRDQGITFLISSHQLSELEQVCDRYVFIDHGRVLAVTGRDELLSAHGSLEHAFLRIVARTEGWASD